MVGAKNKGPKVVDSYLSMPWR